MAAKTLKAPALGLLGAIAVTTAAACGGSSGTSSNECVPGQSIACAGPGACSGYQTCNGSGAYDPCVCESDAAAPMDASSGDGQGSDAPDSDGASSFDSSDGAAADGTGGDGTGSDGTSGDDGGAWSPKQLSGLSLWLESSVGVVADLQNAGQVKRWLDQSGNGNDATGECNNGGGADSLPDIDLSAIHGHDGITCGGTAGYGTDFIIADAPSLQFGTGNWGLAFVYKPYGGLNSVTLWTKGGGLSIAQSIGQYQVFDGTASVIVATNSSKFQYVIARGSALDVQTAAAKSTGAMATTDISAPGSAVYLCSNPNLNQGQAELAEVIAVKGTLSDSDVAALVAYFTTKYGF